VVKGRKTENEKFPGAHYTTTIETFISANGRGLQAATSHCLGQSFAKMYDITVEDPSSNAAATDGTKPRLFVWQNSWGLSVRCLGAMMMTHGDDKGAVIPPRVAETQAALIPVGLTAKTTPEAKKELLDQIQAIGAALKKADIRVEVDISDAKSPGWKFNQYEVGFVLITQCIQLISSRLRVFLSALNSAPRMRQKESLLQCDGIMVSKALLKFPTSPRACLNYSKRFRMTCTPAPRLHLTPIVSK
jgi:hypothetical protein